MVGRGGRTVAVTAWWVLLAMHLAVLYWPTVPSTAAPSGTDKVVHVLVFALPTIAAILALSRPWWVVVALALHAPLSEVLQATLLTWRSGDWQDAVADLVGVALGVAIGGVWRRRALAAKRGPGSR